MIIMYDTLIAHNAVQYHFLNKMLTINIKNYYEYISIQNYSEIIKQYRNLCHVIHLDLLTTKYYMLSVLKTG